MRESLCHEAGFEFTDVAVLVALDFEYPSAADEIGFSGFMCVAPGPGFDE
jgi:hypothetical protein